MRFDNFITPLFYKLTTKCIGPQRMTIRHCSAHKPLQWPSKSIRQSFIDYFVEKDHTFVKSSTVVPPDDSLRLVVAGMNQFKPIFLNTIEPEHPFATLKRAVNSQKCIRMGGKHNDLDLVGKSFRHHTFFEMLGNWSFGDYYKEDACKWAWQLLIDVWKIDPNRLIVTYFAGDHQYKLEPDLETREVWLSLGVPADRILPLGIGDNFWEMGSSGPCGPCTEIHYIINPATSYQNQAELLERSIEIWNLVLIQYNKTDDGILEILPRKHVDTGMGLERIASILQTKHQNSNYDTDLFQPLFEVIEKAARVRPYQGSLTDQLDISYRIVADHARSLTIAIADGLKPGTARTGHKLRKLIRAANWHTIAVFKMRSGRFLLTELANAVADMLGDVYQELEEKRSFVNDTIINECNLLRYQLQKQRLEFEQKAQELRVSGETEMSGETAYALMKSVGTSKEMLAHMAHALGVTINFEEFNQMHANELRISAEARAQARLKKEHENKNKM